MAIAIQLPGDYGYVLAAATSTFFVNTMYMIRTAKFRKAAGVKYPAAYATTEQAEKDPAAHRFNCAQRAHANFTENHSHFLGALLIAGLRFPIPSAIAGAGWALARVFYLYGYTGSSGPRGRSVGAMLSSAADLALKLMAAYTSYLIITDN